MEYIFVFFIVILLITGISDLIVGVSNDAVNFLNSPIGSKVAPYWLILVVASLGILMGAIFSNGMLDIARKGIFHPENFCFSEIMVIFLAAMITNVLLIDVYNSLGLPTSTTVALIFGILGSSMAISMLKIKDSGETFNQLSNYLYAENTFIIIGGIFFSIILAFVLGLIIQYFIRLIFTFNYRKKNEYLRSIWGGISFASITFFILKGVKNLSFLDQHDILWIDNHSKIILVGFFFSWAILLQLLQWVFKINTLKLIVLLGTFAVALSFASNDMVNFVGAPLAGLKSYQAYLSNPIKNPDIFKMEVLKGQFYTPVGYLIIAGLIMVLTLWFSRKARTVIETEVDLSRQNEGYEKFGSSLVARAIVRTARRFSHTISNFFPSGFLKKINNRFDHSQIILEKKNGDKAAFDLLRASVNLTIASILISAGTAYKLPVSTTYITFMVAMGTSLADRSWGRDNAVFRVSGVLFVMTGWIFTGLIALACSFIFALFIHWGSIWAVFFLLAGGIIFFVRSHFLHKDIEKQKALEINNLMIKHDSIFNSLSNILIETIGLTSRIYKLTVSSLIQEDRKQMKNVLDKINDLKIYHKRLKRHSYQALLKIIKEPLESIHYYIQILDALSEILNSLSFIVNPAYQHLENDLEPISKEQANELMEMNQDFRFMLIALLRFFKDEYFDSDIIFHRQQEIYRKISEFRKRQLRRLKKSQEKISRNNLLYLEILSETKNLVLFTNNILKIHKDFLLIKSIHNQNE
jgi:phosphate/sulfate permease